jgi:hypothetical protein
MGRIEWLTNWSQNGPYVVAHKIEGSFDLFGESIIEQIKPWVQICLLENFKDVLERLSEEYKSAYEKNPENAEKSDKFKITNLIENEFSSYKEKQKKRQEEQDKTDEWKEYRKYIKAEAFERMRGNERRENDPTYKLYNTLQKLKYQTSTSIWLSREIDKNTGLWYFVIVISTFVITLLAYRDFLKHFPIGEQYYPFILVLSIVALSVVLFMLYFRHKGLRSMALVTFKFLAEQAAIKIDKESFDKTLEEIRQYLNEGDWTLAGIWVTRLMDEYNDHIKEKMQTGEIFEPKDKGGEWNIMIKWKNGEMTVEEIKDKEKKEK